MLGEGNVFTGVCLSTWGCVSLVPDPFKEGWYVQRGGYVQGVGPHPRHATWDTMGYSRQAGSTHPTGMLLVVLLCTSLHH